MKKDISPEVLAFLKNLPKLSSSEESVDVQSTFTEADEVLIKVMLDKSTDPQALADRKVLKKYILNQNFKDDGKITDADREAMVCYLQKYAPEFYKLLLKSNLR